MGPSFRTHPTITIKLFKTLIQPILLYASDFWGTLKLPNNNPIENAFMKFCKELFGVQKHTPNVGVLLELGETTLSFIGSKNAIKNWVRISNYKQCNNLVTSSYKSCIDNDLSWPKRIRDTLSHIGMLDTFLNKDPMADIFFSQRMSDIFQQNTFSEIKKDTSKLRT